MPSDPNSAADRRKLVHVSRIEVRWSDIDMNEHVNNTVYFRYIEQARIEWFDACLPERRDGVHGTVVANAYLNFLKSITYPGAIEVDVHVSSPGRSSFMLHYELYKEKDRTVKFADGYTRMVWIELGTGRSAPLPARVRALMA